MNQELILKAVKAVMDFNENVENHSCGIDLASFGARVYIFEHTGEGVEYLMNEWESSDKDLKNFIEKLNELKGE